MGDSHGRFVWYELMTTDLEAANAFYGEVVGWRTREASMPGSRYTLFTAGDVSAAGLIDLPQDSQMHGAAPQWVGYVSVDDVDAAAHHVKELDGTVYVPPTDIADVSRFSVVADPQMATFILVKWRDAGRQLLIQSGALGHVGWHELLTIDWERAFAFYREIFGWQKAAADAGPTGTYLQFSAGGRQLVVCSTSRRLHRPRFGFTTLMSQISVRHWTVLERDEAKYLRGQTTYQAVAGSPAVPIPKALCSH